ncbi:MAG: hypothetical protein RL095_2229, partial [Verrucomicrobiota bacterium]
MKKGLQISLQALLVQYVVAKAGLEPA